MANFVWGSGGQQISSPEQAARQRAIAEALIGQSATPGSNWAEGLADVAAALSGSMIEGRVSEAEQAGRERAGGLFADLAVNSDPNAIIAALTSPDAAWASPAQTSIASALLNSGLERNDPMYQAQLAKLQADVANGGQGTESFFGNIVPMQDAEGNVVLGQASNQGNWQPLQGAEGFSPAPTTKQIDTGTEIITTDVYGNQLYRTPKDLRGAEAQKVVGAAEGAAAVAAPGDIASGEMALDLLDQIENNPELPWATGQSVQFGGNTGLIPGTQGRMDFQNLVNQATSGAFLTAIGEMRGLGSLSNAEGQTATAAVTRMNTATSEGAFRKALADYKEVIQRGLERARSRLPGGSQPSPEGSVPIGTIEDGYRYRGGPLGDQNSWEKVN